MTLIATNALLMNKTVRTFTKGLIFSDILFSTEKAYISGQTEYYTVKYYTILYYTILYYTILYYTILYYTIL